LKPPIAELHALPISDDSDKTTEYAKSITTPCFYRRISKPVLFRFEIISVIHNPHELPQPVRSTGLSHEDSPMTKLCPRCGSQRVVYTHYGQRVGGTVGTVAGAVSGAATSGPTGALIGSRIGMQVGVIAGPAGVGAGAVLGAIAGAFAGCLAGLRLGRVVDQHLLCRYRCLDCRSHF